MAGLLLMSGILYNSLRRNETLRLRKKVQKLRAAQVFELAEI